MKKSNTLLQNAEQANHIDAFLLQVKNKSDKLMNYFLAGYFVVGLLLAAFYDTWLVAIGVGGFSLIAYYSAKLILRDSNLYQYVLSAVLGIFMAQYIYQMHGMFEMHFIAFIGSAVLITYQNWKLQIPIMFIVIVHHAVFAYLQYIGNDKVYFTELDYMALSTFTIHILLASAIFFICGLWAYNIKKSSEKHIEQSFEIGRLQREEAEKKELQKANLELDKFVYSVSHDLRAPLSSIRGVVELSEEETTDPLMLEHFSLIKGSVKKLDDFIQDILSYSRNARTEVKKQDINFKEMLEDITNNLRHMSSNNERKVDITYEINNHRPFISDKTRITILLNNLISNAIRYQNPSTNNPFVDVKVNMSDVETDIIIKDNGIGISKQNQEKIFEMFYRVTENSVGSGLGLYIVKEAVEKLNGQIVVESELGIGTSFNIRIPNN